MSHSCSEYNSDKFRKQGFSNSEPEKHPGDKFQSMHWGERLQNRLHELGWNIPELARQMGREDDKSLLENLAKYVKCKVDNPRGTIVAEIAKAIGMTEPELKHGSTITTPPKTRDRFTPTVLTTVGQSGDMPLYRFANGGKGSPILEQIPFETATRPESLARVRDPYGVMIDGTSMIPEYYPGWVAHVNPNLTPVPGDTCIFRGERADGSHWACVKVLRRETDTHWHVEQHNPPKGEHRAFTLKKSEYQVAHVTVGADKRRR